MDTPEEQRTGLSQGPGGRPTAGPRENAFIEEADGVIRDLFAVGITLESCAESLGVEMALRLHGAVAQLDGVINRLRRAALYLAVPALSAWLVAEGVRTQPDRDYDNPGQNDVIDRLLAEARRAVERCESESPSPANEIEVVDSVQSLHRAIVGLADAMEGRGAAAADGEAGLRGR